MSLNGKFEDLDLPDIFQILSMGKKSGILVINNLAGAAMVTFKNGLVVRAETNAFKRTLGHDLLHCGIVKESDLQIALKVKQKLPGKSIPEILFDFNAVNKNALEKASRKRIEKVIHQILLWNDSNFKFEVDDLDPKNKIKVDDFGWEVTEGINPEYLIMEGLRIYDETFRQFIPQKALVDRNAGFKRNIYRTLRQ